MLKKNALLLILLLMAMFGIGQEKKDFKLDELVRYPSFRQQELQDYAPMNDGSHFSKLEDNGKQILKLSYVTGNVVSVLFDLE